MDFNAYFTDTINFFVSNTWILLVFLIVFVSSVLNWRQRRVLKKLHTNLLKTETFWDDALLESLNGPATALIWLVGLTLAAHVIRNQTAAVIFDVVDPASKFGFIVIATWFLVRFINNAEENLIKRNQQSDDPIDRTTADSIAKLLRISVIITAFLVIIQTLGYSISGVLAFGGISGIAVGFAAKDLLTNFFGGLMIYLDRPFSVGDWIRSPDREIEGTVEHIGWRLTRIRTFDKRPLYLPDGIFTTISVENPSRMSNRRIYETIWIRYDDAGKMEKIITEVKQMILDHPEIDPNQTLIVNFNKFAASSLDFFVYTFTNACEWVKYHDVKQDVMLKIIRIIENNGEECAFPTSTIHIQDGVDVS